MANELQALTTTGLTLYAVLVNATGQIWNTAGTPAFEAYNGANWTDYDIALTEAGAGIYLANMPAAAAGSYSYAVYEKAGASPATTDTLKGTGYLEWDGSAVLPLSTIESQTDDIGVAGAGLTAIPAVDVGKISGDSAAADNLEAMLDGTGGVDLDLKQLHLTGAAGPGLLITSSAVGGGAVKIESTAVVSGIGIDIDASGGGSIGIDIDAVGTGASLAGSASDGVGLNVAGGSGSGAGLSTSGYSGINAIGTANDIIGDIIGNLSGSVGSVASGGITAASIATGAIDADALAADAVTEIQAGLATSAEITAIAAILTAIKGAGWSTETLVAIDVLLDAIKAKTDLITSATTINVTAPVVGSTISITRGDTLSADINGLGSVADYVSLDFTVKRDQDDDDDEAILRIRKNLSGLEDGLITLNGADAASANKGSITIDNAATGDITIALSADVADDLSEDTLEYDIQKISATAVKTMTYGVCKVVRDVTRAVV